MKDMPDAAGAETQVQPPDVIYLPDQSRRTRKKITSGSNNRRRKHLEWFRTDDTEHAALHAKVRASGKSLGAYVMQLAAIDAAKEARARRRAHVSVDTAELARAQVAFGRANNNLNQIAHAANRLALEAADYTSHRIAAELHDLCRAVDSVREEFAAPLAAILEAVKHDREG